MSKRARLPDPVGMIRRIKVKMQPNCSVRKSKYCEQIIAMRMQGITFQEIDNWLTEQGIEHRIPASTIWKNFKGTKMRIDLTHAEEIAEKWGGTIEISPLRELAAQIMIQKRRIDKLIRRELKEQEKDGRYGYHDRRIKVEMDSFRESVKTFQTLSLGPVEAAEEARRAEENAIATSKVTMSKDGEEVLVQLILSGDLNLGELDDTPTKH